MHDSLSEVVLHTGQHYDSNMSDVFFNEMEIPEPRYNLGIQSSLQGDMTGKMLAGIESVILKEKPDAVLVYGDTNSTLAGAIAATKLHVKLIHVEAGLRSFNMEMPEEINRIITDRISDLLFCPTETAMNNLRDERFDKFKCTFLNSGDVMLDAAVFYSERIKEKSVISGNDNFILCTVHRAENTNDPGKLKNIITALNEINKKISVIIPMHPRTKKTVEALGLKVDCKVIEPVGYLTMIALLKNCSLVMTDSGGLQKEAYFFSKYCVTLREETEWTELVENNFNLIAGSETDSILNAVNSLLDKKGDFSKKLFGNGKAAASIVSAIEKYI
jgi:UDP-GlcNAc3NAcA epimerase